MPKNDKLRETETAKYRKIIKKIRESREKLRKIRGNLKKLLEIVQPVEIKEKERKLKEINKNNIIQEIRFFPQNSYIFQILSQLNAKFLNFGANTEKSKLKS